MGDGPDIGTSICGAFDLVAIGEGTSVGSETRLASLITDAGVRGSDDGKHASEYGNAGQTDRLNRKFYFTRRPWKNPAFVVFCFMFAVSPSSATFFTLFLGDVSVLTSGVPPTPFWVRLAGGIGGISLWRDIAVSPFQKTSLEIND
jgi:hypothetical protein